MATWNAEGMTKYDLKYFGTTTATGPVPGQITVFNAVQTTCPASNLAAAAGPACAGGATIAMFMNDFCNSTTRQWRVGWAPPPTDTQGVTGPSSYEAVMTHELGHMFGYDDVALATAGPAMMNGAPVTNALAAWLHLYPIDRDSQIVLGGATTRRPRTSISLNGMSGWSVPAIIPPAGIASTSPSLDGNTPSARPPLTTVTNVFWAGGADFAVGPSWVDRPNPSTGTESALPMGIANSTFGETLVVWASACEVQVSGCDISWAWTNNEGTSWTTGTFSTADTFTKPYVEYDAYRDRFVLAYVSMTDQRIQLTSTPAVVAPIWTSPSNGYQPMRHLGGMIFDGPTGLMVASSGWGGDKGRLLQFNITFSGSQYFVSGANYLTDTDSRTRRPFGIARRNSEVVVVWRDTGTGRNMFACSKTTISASVRCNTPNSQITDVRNGVDLAYDPVANRFTAGMSR